jgi:hypothetical protein
MEEPADVPVLTDVVEGLPEVRPAQTPMVALEGLAQQLERSMMDRLGGEIDRATALALDAIRAELKVRITQMVREALDAMVAQSVEQPRRD